MSNSEYDEEILHVEVLRSMDSVIDAWENAISLSSDQMCEHLEQITAVVEGAISYREFIEITGLKNIKHS